jgi:hypothetical protein
MRGHGTELVERELETVPNRPFDDQAIVRVAAELHDTCPGGGLVDR